MRNRMYGWVAYAALMFLAACSGESTKPVDTAKPTPEVISVSLELPSTAIAGEMVNVRVVASASKGSPVSTSCTLDNTTNISCSDPRPFAVGTHTVCVTGSVANVAPAQDCKTIAVSLPVVPTLVCKAVVNDILLGESSPKGIRIRFFRGTDEVTVTPSLDGNCSVQTTLGAAGGDSISYVLDAIDTGNRLYHPKIGKIAPGKPNTILIDPWGKLIVPQGALSGKEFVYDLDRAYMRSADSLSFYNRALTVKGTDSIMTLTTATHALLPQPLAFRNDLGDQVITAADSVIFWGWMDTFEKFFSMDLLRPAVANEVTLTDGTTFFISSVIVNSPTTNAIGSAVDMGNGELISGRIVFRSLDYWRKVPGSSFHELIHFFGFGHGCGWSSLLNYICPSETNHLRLNAFTPGEPSAYDVGYILMFLNNRRLERKYNTTNSIVDSYRGEQALILNSKSSMKYARK